MQIVTEDLGYERRTQAFYIVGLAQRKTGQRAEALKSFEKSQPAATPGFAAALCGGRRHIFCAAKAADCQASAGSIRLFGTTKCQEPVVGGAP